MIGYSYSTSPDGMADEEPFGLILGLSDPNVKMENSEVLESELRPLEPISELIIFIKGKGDPLSSNTDLLELQEADAMCLYPLLSWYALIMHGELPEYGQLKDYMEYVSVDSLVQLLVSFNGSKWTDSWSLEGIKWTLEGLNLLLSKRITIVESGIKTGVETPLEKVVNCVLDTLIKNCDSSVIISRICSHFEFSSMDILSMYRRPIEKLDFYNRLRWRVFVILASTHLIKEDGGITAMPNTYPQGIPQDLLGLVQEIDRRIPGLRQEARQDRLSVNRRLFG